MLVAVGSINPCKLRAVKNVFSKVWSQAEVRGVKVSSEVSHQPFGDQEIIRGALTRARKSLKLHQADFGVGIEGGVKKINRRLFTTAWCAIVNQKGEFSLGGGLMMPLPKRVSQKLSAGKELGEAMDELTGIRGVKKKMGAVGILTQGLVNRTQAYQAIVAYSLSKFLKPKI